MARWFTDGGKLRRTFGYPRPAGSSNPTRHHAGIDIIVEHHAPVYAPQDGRVVRVQTWDGPQTRAVLLAVPGGVWLIGGLDPATLAVADRQRVHEGELLGAAGRYPNGGVYIHVEWYAEGTTRNAQWPWGEPMPPGLRDPGPAIDALLAGREPAQDPTGPTDDPSRPQRPGGDGPTPRGLVVGLATGVAGAVVGWWLWRRQSPSSGRRTPR